MLNRCKIFTLVFLLVSLNTKATQLLNIHFSQDKDVSKVAFEFDQPNNKFNKFHVSDDKQIIVDFPNVKASHKVMRAMDTSEFSGTVVLVSPYKKPGSKNDLRVAIQLRDNVRSTMDMNGKKLILNIENRFGVFTKNALNAKKRQEEQLNMADNTSGAFNIPKSDSLEDILENLIQSGPKKYAGKRISINVRNLPIIDVLKMIADASGFNVIISKEVESVPNITLNLTNIPWDQSLDTILQINKLVATKNGNILMITTLKKAIAEKEARLKAEELNRQEVPLVTKVFPISFAKPEEISKILNEYLTPARGKISIDNRTNQLIVKDIPEVIERMKKIIEVLDTQTPQVQIESKIVEITDQWLQKIGLEQGVSFNYDPIRVNNRSFNHPSNIGTTDANGWGADSAGTAANPGGFIFSTGTTADKAVGIGLNIIKFHRLSNLNFQLQLMESESKGKVISAPKVITQNGEPANITSAETEPFEVSTINAGVTTTTFDEKTATTSLVVTPEVTNEGSIMMDVAIVKGGFKPRANTSVAPATTERSLKTKVLVDNGSTVVLGGLYKIDKSEGVSGIPFLKDLPLLGWLFRGPTEKRNNKDELIIFITPRIINIEKAGLIQRDDELE